MHTWFEQNVNKCLNGLIWERCPKTTYVEQSTVALALDIEDLDIAPGAFTSEGAKECDQRINLSAGKKHRTNQNQKKNIKRYR